MLRQACLALVDEGSLQPDQLREALQILMQGNFRATEAAAFLTALRLHGETADELAIAVQVLREHMVRLETGSLRVLDTCGTGGDGSGTFNISTAVALVVAACGVPVVKHGNRGATSPCGSADVLAALGVNTDAEPLTVERCVEEVGFGFCFAPCFHPAMRHVAEIRRDLGFRTIFNLLGPLLNPAQAPFQLIGVSRPDALETMADCLAKLGGVTAHLVHGEDGLDEVTLGASTLVRRVSDGKVDRLRWTPQQFGLPRCSLSELRVAGVADSAAEIRRILNGEAGPATDVVLANAAAALLTVERVGELREGVEMARKAIKSGAVKQVLERLVAVSHQASPPAMEKS
jgi:anthranilate phosphoribosyltransferase